MLNSEAQLMQHLGSLRHQEELDENEDEHQVQKVAESTVTITECPDNN